MPKDKKIDYIEMQKSILTIVSLYMTVDGFLPIHALEIIEDIRMGECSKEDYEEYMTGSIGYFKHEFKCRYEYLEQITDCSSKDYPNLLVEASYLFDDNISVFEKFGRLVAEGLVSKTIIGLYQEVLAEVQVSEINGNVVKGNFGKGKKP